MAKIPGAGTPNDKGMTQINLRVNNGLYTAISNYAIEEKSSLSNEIRKAITHYLNERL